MLLEEQLDFDVVRPGDDLNASECMIFPSRAGIMDGYEDVVKSFLHAGGNVLVLGDGLLNAERSETTIDCGAEYLGAGEFDWQGFGKGGLYLLLFVEYGILYLTYLFLGITDTPQDFAILYIQDPTPFYVLGRLSVAVMGVVCCGALYLIGRKLYGSLNGVIAATLCAVWAVFVEYSSIINVDIGMESPSRELRA